MLSVIEMVFRNQCIGLWIIVYHLWANMLVSSGFMSFYIEVQQHWKLVNQRGSKWNENEIVKLNLHSLILDEWECTAYCIVVICTYLPDITEPYSGWENYPIEVTGVGVPDQNYILFYMVKNSRPQWDPSALCPLKFLSAALWVKHSHRRHTASCDV